MKIYSEVTKELYDDVKECQKAEEAYAKKQLEAEEKQKALEAKVAEEKAAISKKRKELSDAIEKADEDYVAACNVYDVARKQADDIIVEARKKASDILSAAAKEVEKASENKMNAVAEFNKEFGPYRTVVTGNKAIELHNRVVSNFNRMFNNALSDFFDRI